MVPETALQLVGLTLTYSNEQTYFDMKKNLILFFSALFMLAGSGVVSAQGKYGADSAECIKYLSYYNEYYKQKNYDDALPNWRKAYSLCPPTANQTMLINGTSLYRRLISQNRNNPVYLESLIDTLMTLHDIRAQYYPKYEVTALNNKGLDMINYVKDDPQRLYEEFKVIIDKNQDQVKPQILLFQLNTACQLYQNGSLMPDDVMEEYNNVMTILDNMKQTPDIEKIRTDCESLFIASNVASCDNLIALFTPRYEEAPDSLQLVSNIVRMLSSTEGCTDNDLFMNASISMHQLDPSYNSAYFLYRLYSTRGDVDNAFKYIEEAISYPESDNIQDAQYYYEAAAFAFKSTRNAEAFNYALKAADLDPSLSGKSYMLIGTIWGSLVCKGNEIETRAPYWVAVDYLVKAKNADPSLAEEANKLIAQYRQYYPQTAEAFMYNVTDGDSYTVSCGGMRAVTTVKTQQ